MEEALIAEILDGHGRVRQRIRLSLLPSTIGRSYQNEVVLDDPYVSPQHVRLEREADGTVVAVDLGSTNGIHAVGGAPHATRLVLGRDTTIVIGHTNLRLRPASFDVGAALPRPNTAPPGWRLATGHWGWLVPTALILGWTEIGVYLNSYEELKAVSFIGPPLLMLGVLGVWGGFWAVISRITVSRFLLGPHLFVAATCLLGSTLSDNLSAWAAFAFDVNTAAQVFDWLAGAAVVSLTLFGHLRLCSEAPHRRILWSSLGITAVLFSGIAALWFGRTMDGARAHRFTLEFDHRLWPAMFRVSGGESLDQFMRGAGDLKGRVDELAIEDARDS